MRAYNTVETLLDPRQEMTMRVLRMLSGLAARLLSVRSVRALDPITGDPVREKWSLHELRTADSGSFRMRDGSIARKDRWGRHVHANDISRAALGGCYHDGVAYSLGYDANGVVELSGETFTNLSGAEAALQRHRQNFDAGRDIPRFIVALSPVKVSDWRSSSDTKAYGLPPGPLAGDHPTAEVWGEHVAQGRFNVVKDAVERVKQDCERRGVDISKSTVTISVKPEDGQDAFARCEKVDIDDDYSIEALLSSCDECSSLYCECDGTCDPDYATSCHMCDTWVCAYCVVEGACHNCFSKMQGGVI